MTQAQVSEGYTDRSLAVGVLGLVMVALILYLSMESVEREREVQRRIVGEQVRTVLDLSVAQVSQTIGSVRESLRLYSRLPVAYGPRPRPVSMRLATWADGMRAWAGLIKASAAHRDDEAFPALVSMAMDGVASTSEGVRPEFLTPEGLNAFYRLIAATIESAADHVLTNGAWVADLLDVAATGTEGRDSRPDAAWYQQILDRTLPASGPVLSLALFDAAERRCAEATRVDTAFGSLLTRGVVRRALAGTSSWFVAGSVSFNDAVGAPIWVVGAPLIGNDLQPVGVVVAVVHLGFLQGMANAVRVMPGAELLVVDEHGTALAHPRRAQVTSQANLKQANDAVVRVLKGDDAQGEVQYRGSAWYAGWRNLTNLKQAGVPRWGVVLMVPAATAFAAGDRVANQIYLMALLGIAVVAYFCRLIASSLEDF